MKQPLTPAQAVPASSSQSPSSPPSSLPTKPSKKSLSSVQLAEVAIVLPVYNEEACISRTLEAIRDYLQTHPNYTFIFVNDGSSDRTKEILSTYLQVSKTGRLQLLSYDQRGGKGYAIKTGMAYAESEYICFFDSDLAYALEHLDALVEKLQVCDVVIGCRNLVPRYLQGIRWQRKLAGKIYNLASRVFLNLPFRDMQAGLKGFRREKAKALFARQHLLGFSFDVELMYLAKKWGFSIGEIPARVSDSHQVKVSKVNLVEDSLKMLRDLFRIRLNDVLGRYR
ncbi:MAG: glycosyltransferase [Synechococcales bacterium]|nr:glycosyltransferase [Synechococcales bacterium]